MLEKLIEEGIELESQAEEGTFSKYFDSVLFETWVAKSMLYLEKSYPESTVTEKAKLKYKVMDNTTNYEFYQFLLGTLKGIEDLHAASFESFN